MAYGQTYNQYTKCVLPTNYGGTYLWGPAFWMGSLATLFLLIFYPGAAPLTAILTAIGYCRWWLYARLVCMGNSNICVLGLVLRIDPKQDQSGLGDFDTDYTLYLLLVPNPLIGDQNWLNDMNNPTYFWPSFLMSESKDPIFQEQLKTYATSQPYGFSGKSITGYDLVDHDGTQVMPAAQASALNFITPPEWQADNFYLPGQMVQDGNGGLETALVEGLSGSSAPSWPNPNLTNWQPSVGQTTPDYNISWRYDGPLPAQGILEVEFEGAGVWILYQFLLGAAAVAAAGAAVCSIPLIGWVVCLILALVALAVAGIGVAVALSDNSAEGDVDNQVGALTPGVDVLLVTGTAVWDGGHTPQGWNELHPVLYAQRVATVQKADLEAGNPWQSLPQFNPTNYSATLSTMCNFLSLGLDPTTVAQQQLPQNAWTLHPLVDGCTPPPPAEQTQ